MVIIAVVWTAVGALSLYWTLHHERAQTLEDARTRARTAYEKDVIYRRWSTLKGGLYADISEITPPNPYLHVPERDIETSSGRKLTLVNPAYMTRQVHELARSADGVLGHITSLKPIRPDNAPDSWEREALLRFERGEEEVTSIQSINGRSYMRLIRPLVTETGCLKCHGQQGYKAGDIRGGISVAVPLETARAMSARVTAALVGGHAALWLMGLTGLAFAGRRFGRRLRDHEQFQRTLRESNTRLSEALDREKRATVALEATLEQLAAATREAKAATQAKSEFLALMSHEIRTPMTSILGFAETLLDLDLSPVEQKTAAETIRRNGRHLLDLINDVLDLSKIEANMLDVEHVRTPLVPFVAQIESLMRPRARSKNLEFYIEYVGPVPETVQTDPTRLRQVLINLMGNAVKFTDSGSVRLVVKQADPPSSTTTSPESGCLQFDIIDTGIGLSLEQMNRLFQPFSQGEASTTRQYGGTGLGLAISRRIVEKLGGSITVHSALGIGSTFTVVVAVGSLAGVRMLEDPSCIESDAKNTEPAEPPLEPLRCRVLLAEDGPDNQRLISYLLTKAGAEVVVVDNGKSAVEMAMAAEFRRRANDPDQPFDMVLMDMQMPVMDGYEATRRLRERNYHRPIVALTAHAMAEDRARCLDAGCDDFVTKPVPRKKLIELVREHTLRAQTPAVRPGDPPTRNAPVPASGGAEAAVEGIRADIASLGEVLAARDYAALTEASARIKRRADEAGWPLISVLADTLGHTLQSDPDLKRLQRQIDTLAALCESGPAASVSDERRHA